MGAQVTQLVECNKKGMLYAPGQPGIDGQGCKSVSMPNPATLNITPRTQTLCTRGGTHTVISSCAGGERLLGCGGGAGDMDSSHEYWVLMPEFQNNRCVGYIGNPACYGAYYSQAMVTAICYTP
ncbi:MAG: hypothetical protein DI585_07290 [Pseudomonas fluorescens]|nr:MAG: hypothetical protein DI585_07290 [Pseudomonas fluorescens]